MATGDQRAVPDFQSVFESLPGQYLILAPDAPAYTILGMNDAYLGVTNRTREQLVGTPLFDAFPVNPDDPQATGMHNVRASLDAVLRTGRPHALGVQRYDIAAESGAYEERYWKAVNLPVPGDDGRVRYVVHRVEDVTDEVRGEAALRETRERHRAVLEALHEGVTVHDATGAIVMANPSAERFLGLTVDQMKGTDSFNPRWRAVTEDGADFPPDQHPPQTVVRTGQPVTNVVFGIHRGDDTLIWVSANAVPLRDPATGRVTGSVCSFFDVTDRKRAEEALRESETRFRALFDSMGEGFCVVEMLYDDAGRPADYRFVETNPTFARHTGFHDAVGRTIRELVPNHDAHWFDIYGAVAATGEPKRFVEEAKAMGRWYDLYAFRVGGPDSRRVAILFTDITERKRADAERERLLDSERAARDEAERASRMKDEFLATLSHELRTPLNAILGWSQLLAHGKRDAEDLAEGLKTIERNARAQTGIIEDLLDMSRIVSGKVRLDVQRIDLAPLVQAAVETVRPAAEAKGIRIHSVLDPQARPVSGDPNRLQQVFWNLLTNAVKFTPRGGRVQVLLERVNSHLEVSVIDTGEGIGPEFLPHVFDRFRQADASTSRRHGGLGLGLSIAKQLAELHGGSIRVKSGGEGRGSTFTVSLPLTVIHPDAEPAPQRRHPDAYSPDVATDYCPRLAGVRALVVDDEADARALIKRLLEECDAAVQTAGSVDEALGIIQTAPPDVLLSDIGMPGEDGYSLIRRVRALGADRGGKVPALALTAYARSEDRMRAVAAGYQMHVAKPVEPAELIMMVAALAGRTAQASGITG